MKSRDQFPNSRIIAQWTNHLKGADHILRLPVDRQFPQVWATKLSGCIEVLNGFSRVRASGEKDAVNSLIEEMQNRPEDIIKRILELKQRTEFAIESKRADMSPGEVERNINPILHETAEVLAKWKGIRVVKKTTSPIGAAATQPIALRRTTKRDLQGLADYKKACAIIDRQGKKAPPPRPIGRPRKAPTSSAKTANHS